MQMRMKLRERGTLREKRKEVGLHAVPLCHRRCRSSITCFSCHFVSNVTGVEVGEGDEGGEGGEEGGGGGGGGRLVKFSLLKISLVSFTAIPQSFSPFCPLPFFSPSFLSLSFRRRRRKKKSASRAKLPNKPTDFQVSLP